MVRKHQGIHQAGPMAGKLKPGYKYSGKKLKSGLAEIVKTSIQKGGQGSELYFQNEGRNIMKALYHNNTKVYFMGTFHPDNLMSEHNMALLLNILITNPNAELWVEFRDNVECHDLWKLFNADDRDIETVEDALTKALITHLSRNNVTTCPRPNFIRGWDHRYTLLLFRDNKGQWIDAQHILYNSYIPDLLTLGQFREYFIERMPYPNVKADMLKIYNNLRGNKVEYMMINRALQIWSEREKKQFGHMVTTLQKQFAISTDDIVHNRLLREQNKTIFVIQGFYHFEHFAEIFLPNSKIPFEADQDIIVID